MKRKPWNKPTKPFPNKWKRKLAKSDKGSYYKQGQWISEYEDGKGQHYNEYCDDDLDLVTTDESSCSGELEAQSHNDSVPHDSILAKIPISTFASSLVLQARKYLCSFMNTAREKSELDQLYK